MFAQSTCKWVPTSPTSVKIALDRVRNNCPLNITEFQLGYSVSYSYARKLFDEPDFPLVHGRVFPSSLELWARRNRNPHSPVSPQLRAFDKVGAPLKKSGSPISWRRIVALPLSEDLSPA